jgi:hypothetical protein
MSAPCPDNSAWALARSGLRDFVVRGAQVDWLNQRMKSASQLFRIVKIDRAVSLKNPQPRSVWPHFATWTRKLPGYNYQAARLFMYFQKE